MKTLLLASVLFAGVIGSLTAPSPLGPSPALYHAYCNTVWLFATPCLEISTTLMKQIQAFSPVSGCAKCHYTLVSATPLSIKANHTSADGLNAETIKLSFSPTVMTGGCRVAATSASHVFTSLFDDGVNYCNLFDLLSASGLTSAPGFMEVTSEWACLGYGLTCKA